MKIILLSQFFSSTRGGGEHLFYILVKNFAENNHQVWIITNKIIDENYPTHKNINIVFVPPILKYQGGLPPSFKDNIRYLINAVKIGKKIIKENKIEIIHSNNFTPAITGGILSFLTSTRHITSIWDIFTMCGCDYWKKWVNQAGVSKINQFIGPIFERIILKTKCDAFHTISAASKDDLVKFGAKKQIYNIPPTIEDIQKIKTLQNNKQFIYVGRLVFYKNVEILVKAISIVKKQDSEIKLVLVGEGPQHEKIQNLVNELNLNNNIIMKGYVSFEEKIKLISQSNAMLFPSLCEGFGLVILESWQQKRPVLVSDLPPMSDIIEHERTGLVIDPYDGKKWAKNIIRLINESNISESMGIEGNKILKTKYNQRLFYERLTTMYNEVLKQNNRHL